ncbi:hypothetical protein BHM03_00038807 [Ensete ventricosum]|nr:hypothetical protein BHM03_00038807 [Ensete ventricosum]
MDFQQQTPTKSMADDGEYRSPIEFSPVLHGLVVGSSRSMQGVSDTDRLGKSLSSSMDRTGLSLFVRQGIIRRVHWFCLGSINTSYAGVCCMGRCLIFSLCWFKKKDDDGF